MTKLEQQVAEALRPHCDGLMTEWMAAELAPYVTAMAEEIATGIGTDCDCNRCVDAYMELGLAALRGKRR